MYVCIYVCMYVCIHVCVYMHMYMRASARACKCGWVGGWGAMNQPTGELGKERRGKITHVTTLPRTAQEANNPR